MFVDDLRRDFYLKIKGRKILVIVNYDIDAICACKILQSLFRTDCMLYTLVPVDLSSDLKSAYTENHLDEKYIIFINCGGTVDLVEELEPEEDVTFFVLDSHRPIDVCNVYSTGQVALLSKLDESESIPNFSDIFRDDSDDENSNNEDEGEDSNDEESQENQQSKRRRLNEEAIIKRREKRVWEEKRDKLMFDYMQYGYYGRSSALTMYELAWKLSKDSFDLLWYGIVGLNEQMLMSKIDEGAYVAECGSVQNHVARLTHRSTQLSDDGRNTAVRIEFDKDLRLALFRHWTVKSSLTYSVFTATRLKLWTFRGEKRLHEMLAEIGIPLTQCNQKFSSMDLVFKKEFHESIVKMSEKYNLDSIVYVSFLMQYGFRGKYSASDVVYSLLALLQSTNKSKPKADCFVECLEALCRSKKEKLDQGIESAKKILMSVFKQVQSALETKQIQSAGPFLYLIIQEGCVDSTLCQHPYGILLLAEFALKAYSASSKNRRTQTLPLIVSMTCGPMREGISEELEDVLCYVAAIAPIAEESNKNFFGKAFEKAAQNSRSQIRDTYFDSSVVQLNVKDRSKFFDALTVLLS